MQIKVVFMYFAKLCKPYFTKSPKVLNSVYMIMSISKFIFSVFYSINPIYKLILKIGKVPQQSINGLLEIKSTGISIARFEKILRVNNYKILRKTDWFINPNYEIKFSLKPRKLLILNKIPFIKDFFTTCCYCVVKQ